MAAANVKATIKRRPLGMLVRAPWSILISLSALSAGLSACAGTSQAPNARPRFQLSESLETGSLCDGLRGRLPVADQLSVDELTDQWEGAETWGMCQYDRAEQIVAAAKGFEAAWERYDARQ